MRKKKIPFTEETRQGLESHVKGLREQRVKDDANHKKTVGNPIDVGALLRSHEEMLNEELKKQESKDDHYKNTGFLKGGTKAKKTIDLESKLLKTLKPYEIIFSKKSLTEGITDLQKTASFENYSDQQIRRAIKSLRNENRLK